MPQNKSSFCCALALSSRPSAVATSADIRLSQASIAAIEPAQPAAERQSRNPRHGHNPKRRRQPERLRGSVELSKREPGSARPSSSLDRLMPSCRTGQA